MSSSHKKSWIPLESDPNIFTVYANTLFPGYSFNEVLSICDDDLLSLIQRPVEAILICLPTQKIKTSETLEDPVDVFWTPQIIDNACGTIGLIHCLANTTTARRNSKTNDDSNKIQRLLKELSNKPSKEKGNLIANDKEIETYHEKFAKKGENVTGMTTGSDFHYIAIVTSESGHSLVMLDGREEGPKVIGHSDELIKDILSDKSLNIIQNFIKTLDDPSKLSILALTTDNMP